MYEEDRLATPADAMREYASVVGAEPDHINSQWILTDYDVWVRNPHYTGPTQPHPEDYDYDYPGDMPDVEAELTEAAYEAATRLGPAPGYTWPDYVGGDDLDIPF